MELAPQAQAILLLTAPLGKADPDSKPLAAGEWGRFASWLHDRGLMPDSLLGPGWPDLVAEWTDRTVTVPRIGALLGRSAALGLALEKWQRAGLWVLTRSDADYPTRLKSKRRLGTSAPAVLFGCGDRRRLNAGGVAVVGSRDAADPDLRLADELGKLAAEHGRAIVSGGARGIDEHAMLGALENGGTAVGVLADSLLRHATSRKYRRHLRESRLTLITPFNPEARFHVGNAMGRNKYVYCLADAGVVVCCTPEGGGTWAGAVENLERKWVPLRVQPTDSPASGNAALVARGAQWLKTPLGPDTLDDLVDKQHAAAHRPDLHVAAEGLTAPGRAAPAGGEPTVGVDTAAATPARTPSPSEGGDERAASLEDGETPAQAEAADGDRSQAQADAAGADPDFYAQFLRWMDGAAASEPMRPAEIEKRLGLHPTQVKAWLTRGVDEKQLQKLMRPVRYQAAAADASGQPSRAKSGSAPRTTRRRGRRGVKSLQAASTPASPQPAPLPLAESRAATGPEADS